MNDTISREAVADAINGIECTRHTTWYEFYQKVMTAVEKLPPIQPKKGKWIIKDDTERFIAQCNCCRYIEDSRRIKNFCPNCGADMREKGENSETY